MKKTVLTFGFISGAIMSVMMAATLPFLDKIGFDKGEVIGYTSMVLAFLLVFFGIRSYRDNVGNGRIKFGRAFAVGALITAISSACYVATWEVIYFKVVPDFADTYANYEIQKARASGASEEQLAKKTADMQKLREMYKNPFMNAAITFLEPLPVGLVVTLVSAGILSRREKRATLATQAA